MLEFTPIALPHQLRIETYLGHSETQSYEECFATFFIWKDRYATAFAETCGCLLIRMEEEGHTYYLPPLGTGDYAAALRGLVDQAVARGERFSLACLTEEVVARTEAALPGTFTYHRSRDLDDYLHLTASLAEMKGRPFHAKRNHIKKFTTRYAYEYRPLTTDLLPAVLDMTERWCRRRAEEGDLEALEDLHASRLLLENMEPLGAEGGVLLVEGAVAAATVGAPLVPGSDTIVVHYEKALPEYEGAYPTICHFFMRDCASRYTWANREEDLGLEGLRKSKLSYHPEKLLEKYRAEYKGEFISEI